MNGNLEDAPVFPLSASSSSSSSPTAYSIRNGGSLPEVKRPKSEVHHSPSNADVKNERR
jgi:hypothetical protein